MDSRETRNPDTAEPRLFVGAMSGTSADGVDVALVRIAGRGGSMRPELLGHLHRDYPPILRQAIFRIRAERAATLADLARLGRELTLEHAAAVQQVLERHQLPAQALSAVAVHGQTLFHDPPDSIQWFDPSLLAARVGCRVISDFRRADLAAGGQGAPLVPLADFLLFRDEQKSRALLTIGGIANLTFLPVGGALHQVVAFDTGPGNCLSDWLARSIEPAGPGYDMDGRRAAAGACQAALVQAMLQDPFFAAPPPKSTDIPAMVKRFEQVLNHQVHTFLPEDLFRTACQIAATSILEALRRYCVPFPDQVILSGGGARNATLLALLRGGLGTTPLLTSDQLGVLSEAKEALAFAILGAATLDGLPGNVPSATGASRGVVLGSITPPPG